MRSRIPHIVSVTCYLLAGACATVPEVTRFTTISLDKPAHFSATDGAEVVAVPGSY